MNTKCPKCGSLDVRPAYLNYVGRGLGEVAAFTVAFGAGLLMGPGHGHHAAENIEDELRPKCKLKKSHCNSCNHEW